MTKKLAHYLSLEEIQDILEIKDHEDEFDLEKEIVIGNEALEDLKLMKSIIMGLEDFSEEETESLTVFLQDKQEAIGYETTEFSQDNLDIAIESLTRDLNRLKNHVSLINRKGLAYTPSTEAFTFSDKLKKNLAGFMSSLNLTKSGSKKLQEKAERIRKLIEKEEGNSEKDFIKSDAAKKLDFLKEVHGLDLARTYMDYQVNVLSKRTKFYDSIVSDLEEWANFITKGIKDRSSPTFDIQKVINENAKRDWFPKGSPKISSRTDEGDREFYVLAFPGKSVTFSIPKKKEKWADEYPEVEYQKTEKVIKPSALGREEGLETVSRDELLKYLDEVDKYCDDLGDFVQNNYRFVDRIGKAYDIISKAYSTIKHDDEKGLYTVGDKDLEDLYYMFMNAYDFIATEIQYSVDDIMRMVIHGVDFCYDHYS